MRKYVVFEKHAQKEIRTFPQTVQIKFKAILKILEEKGELHYPDAKKIEHKNNLFEIRIKHRGEWRAIYTYSTRNYIIILSAFYKKTQKTPKEELEKAIRRLNFLKGKI
ncbi:MAG: type II toxin-antitoxin system RelE/ParE family toxin [Candidatus Pacebacteria bacterium]|nr:type II toxin-antitoxin system RelE/ParE family toxin [Candidatus Paceibacterota bacterium]